MIKFYILPIIILVFSNTINSIEIQKQQVYLNDQINLNELKKIQAARDYTDFLIGFLEGLEVTISSDYKTCFFKASKSFENFEIGFTLIDSGFRNKSVNSLTTGIRDIGLGIQDIPNIFQICGIDKFVDEIKSISEELSSGTFGIIKIIVKESITIWNSKYDLTNDFSSAVQYYKLGDFKNCGKNVGDIVGILLK